MEEADQKISILEEWLSDVQTKREDQQRKERMNFEIRLQEQKLKLQAEFVKPDKPTRSSTVNVQAKLPKLKITKFNGTCTDWPRFWGQYSETVYKTSVSPVTKFTSLRELLCEKAKKAIEALLYTAEGYNRAVAILEDRFGKDSEVVKAYAKEILDLPYTATTNPKKVHEF